MNKMIENNVNKNAMVFSVGGTDSPIIKSILHYKPAFVYFFTSQQTHQLVNTIYKKVRENNFDFQYELRITDDPENLLNCYKTALDAVKRVISKGYEKDNIIVDYTGGTKNMSVALSLVAINYCCKFSYIGGEREGPTIVIDGKEKVFECDNPWDYLAINEIQSLSILFDKYQFKAAKHINENLIKKINKNKTLFTKIGLIIEAYYQWDLFEYKKALDLFKRAKIEHLDDFNGSTVKKFIHIISKHIAFLNKLSEDANKPSKLLVIDIFSNAIRRYEEGKIDDAMVRLYRIIELIAQDRLLSQYNIDTADVNINNLPDNIPNELKNEFVNKYKSNHSEKIRIGQSAAYKLLYYLGDKLGEKYWDNEKKFLPIQQARNNSYLAHGFQAISENTYNKNKEFLLSLNIFSEDEIIRFPSFPSFELRIQ